MRRLRFALAGLTLLTGLAAWLGSGDGRAQDPGRPAYLQHFYGSAPAAPPLPYGPQTAPQAPVVRGSLPEAEPNQDILVKPEYGPWMVSIISYTGPEAAQMAREMVNELRGPNYNLPAYVFNYAADKRRKERARVDEMIEQMKRRYQQAGAEGTISMRIPKMQIDDQCAVLVGGYNDIDAAKRALDVIRQQKPPDPSKVKLEITFRYREGDKPGTGEGEMSPLNPFRHSFVVRNPATPIEPTPDRNKLDLSVLRKLNRDENYSLLTCPKRFTLAISGYSVPTVLVQQNAPSSFWDKFGLGKGEREDAAAHSAHNLAELMRKQMKIEAYVLHTKYTSVVTVGAYDSADDPRLKQFQQQFARLSADPRYQMLQLFADPKPMQVPR